MPCDQITHITGVTIRDDAALRAVAERAAARLNSRVNQQGASNMGINVVGPMGAVAVNKGSNNRLAFAGYRNSPQFTQVEQAITSEYADVLLIDSLKKVDFFLVETKPLSGDVAKELGPGVEHHFISSDGRQSVVIGRGVNGRLHFEFGGYSEFEAQEVADRIIESMNRGGIETEKVTIKSDTEKWLEEKLPDREAE